MNVRQVRAFPVRAPKVARRTRQQLDADTARRIARRGVRDSFGGAAFAVAVAFLLADGAASIAYRIGIPEVCAYLALGIPVLLLVVGAICEAARLWRMARHEKSGHRG